MPFTVVRFEETPNPNAIKCWLDRRISDGPQSFRDRAAAAKDPVAAALFDEAGATTVLFLDDWITVNKRPEDGWPAMRRRIQQVLAKASPQAAIPAP
ncbi:MAG TPA: NifU N-terminal domain-containing protein [Phycisphaerales bacterium]|mgnify:CR=1 FL=1|nr:NifU N-terminal domain-containing protein [Phycisphaerales bacterium]HMP35904.1 NifU N-terminal domain-containing protein [Phycisphaerales bacterium]